MWYWFFVTWPEKSVPTSEGVSLPESWMLLVSSGIKCFDPTQRERLESLMNMVFSTWLSKSISTDSEYWWITHFLLRVLHWKDLYPRFIALEGTGTAPLSDQTWCYLSLYNLSFIKFSFGFTKELIMMVSLQHYSLFLYNWFWFSSSLLSGRFKLVNIVITLSSDPV